VLSPCSGEVLIKWSSPGLHLLPLGLSTHLCWLSLVESLVLICSWPLVSFLHGDFSFGFRVRLAAPLVDLLAGSRLPLGDLPSARGEAFSVLGLLRSFYWPPLAHNAGSVSPMGFTLLRQEHICPVVWFARPLCPGCELNHLLNFVRSIHSLARTHSSVGLLQCPELSVVLSFHAVFISESSCHLLPGSCVCSLAAHCLLQ
jgi:hypothetical protein